MRTETSPIVIDSKIEGLQTAMTLILTSETSPGPRERAESHLRSILTSDKYDLHEQFKIARVLVGTGNISAATRETAEDTLVMELFVSELTNE